MSPIDENELRDELWFAEPPTGPNPDALGAAVASRGRAVRRRRVAAASVASVLVVALAGIGVWNVLPGVQQDAVPAQTPAPTVTRDPSPSASPDTVPTPSDAPIPNTEGRPGAPHTAVIPSDFGTALLDRTLPDELAPELEDVGAFEPMSQPITCANASEVDLTSLSLLEASRVRGRLLAGDAMQVDGVLLFGSDADATTFMTELSRLMDACDPVGPTGPDMGTAEHPDIQRTLMASGPLASPAAGADAFTVRSWTERQLDGRWVEAPGGSVTLWGRSGRLVAFHASSGEYVGDAVEEAAPGTPDHQALLDLLAMA